MEIVVRQVSGLGNQMFQYAAGRYYAKRYGAGMRVATDLERKSHSHGKMVVAPKNWRLGGRTSYPGLLPPDWILIGDGPGPNRIQSSWSRWCFPYRRMMWT